ncbi:MAG: lipid-A-disaccharide synthase, partial [Limisphaerales bacterium]
MNAEKALRIGLLAGEASGDNLGAGLMSGLRKQYPGEISFLGVGGDKMSALGLESLVDLAELSVNGFRDPIVKLPSLIRTFRKLSRELAASQLDGFIGIDFNVFNFLMESSLRKKGVTTAHYVSPSVYAWRRGRTQRVADVASMILCLFPFEPKFYSDKDIEAIFVGHPLADAIAPDAGDDAHRQVARAALRLPEHATVLAVLPGSRGSEVQLLLPEFLRAAEIFVKAEPQAVIVIPCLRTELKIQIETALTAYPDLPVTLYQGTASQALTAANIALVKSGTSTLETMLLHRPMVVSYRMGGISYQLAKRLMKSPYVALPNILAGRMLVPELLQYEATGETLAAALIHELQASRSEADYLAPFMQLHKQLRKQADVSAATAVLGL